MSEFHELMLYDKYNISFVVANFLLYIILWVHRFSKRVFTKFFDGFLMVMEVILIFACCVWIFYRIHNF